MLAWLVLTTPNASAGVVINEILADPGSVVDANCDGTADSTDDEFVEIVNVGPGSFDLSNATLEDANGEVFTFPAGTVVDELDAVVVFSNGTAVLDGSASGVAPWCVNVTNRATIFVAGSSLSMNNSGDTVIVRDASGTILDEYAYGTAANDDQSIVRNLELIGTDFVKHSTVGSGELASPGSMADLTRFQIPDGKTTIPSGDCDSASEASGLVINEFLTNAPGTDDGFEWVELYNGSGGTVDLSGWAIASGTSSFSAGDPFPGGTTIPDGGYLVIAQSAKVSGGDVVNGGWSLGNATSSSDGVRLEDCNGSVADTVIYGEPNDDEFLDDGGSIATSLAPSPGEGATAARLPDGVDTDRSGADFGELGLPTPGLPNDADVDSPCGGPLTGVVVNEFAPNPEGADEGFEWVELYHAGSEPIDLTGWKIQTATSSWSTYHEFKSGSLSPGAFLLVGGSMVGGTDIVTDKSIGNGSSNTDGVRVVAGPPAFDTGCSTIEPDTSNDARYLGAGTHTVCVAPILDTVVPSYTLSVELVDSCADLPSLAPDPSQDLDGDGIADVCDPDDDDDGVDDVVDNCPDAPNGADSPFPWSTASDGFVTLWMVLGAFTGGVTPGDCEPSPDAFAATSDADAEPVLGDVASDRSWFAWFAWPGDTAILRFTDWFNDAAPREAYVMSWVYSPQQRAASLAVGSDDGQVVWLNGVEVGRKLNCSGVSADQLQFAVTLEAGWNRLLHKVYDGGGGWGVVARFYEEDQVTPMTDLGLSLLGPTDHVDDQTDTDGDGIGDFCDPEP